MPRNPATDRHAMTHAEPGNPMRTREYLAGQPQLVQHYYQQVPFEDIESRDPAELNAAAMSHWNFASKRAADECLVRIYNPDSNQHGWESNQTIIEVTTSDKPFLVRSVALAITRLGYSIGQFIHPIFSVVRKVDGTLDGLVGGDAAEATQESFMQLHIERIFDESLFSDIESDIRHVIADVNLVCDDWEPMKSASAATSQALRESVQDDFTIAESCDFIDWLQRFHFTFTGYAELEETKHGLSLVNGTELGIYRGTSAAEVLENSLPQNELQQTAEDVLYITKSVDRAPVIWPRPMDVLTYRRIDSDGNTNGRCVICGFFTSRADSTDLDSIPILRHKLMNIIARSDFNPGAHDGKILLTTLEGFPRDLLLQSDEDTIMQISRGIMSLMHHPRVRLFGIQDRFQRMATCFVYVPSDIYTRELRLRIQEILLQSLNADNVEFDITLSSEDTLARMLFTLRTPCNHGGTEADFAALEQLVIDAAQNWDDKLRNALTETGTDLVTTEQLVSLSRNIPEAYKAQNNVTTATRDIAELAKVEQHNSLEVLFYRDANHSDSEIGFNIYHSDIEVPLSKTIHILENMGVPVIGEQPYTVNTDSNALNIRVFKLLKTDARSLPVDDVAYAFQQTFLKAWHGEVNDDGLNQLVLTAGLNWRQITILRCYTKYLLQIKIPYSQDYMTTCLINNSKLAQLAVQMFESRFDPINANNKDKTSDQIAEQFAGELDLVTSLDEDRILRTFGDAIAATVRTNYYRRDDHDNPRDYLSIKLIPSKIQGMPLPCPEFEIFVCSPRVEATHLRGGKVARGGLRWSDRREDFRTEVLGLMKAQMVKNSVIVPVGSKGGFVVKQAPQNASREDLMQEVVACYQTFLRGLLDITDNYIDGKVIPPDDVVRQDADDPYLVVAADKGTATFSDIANGVSDEYGFWLGDAFASGGSVGYDHKGMGITAKGAWESVKRHFREYNLNTQEEEFTVVGIGDMSGDVFGNGMLLSNKIRLLAAFNHMHIFLDPSPNAAKTFAERQRLFALPRSTWEDYDSSLISAGGGIYSRSSKSIPITPEVASAFGLKQKSMAPNDLINALLKAKVDLLWNGGIGTYMKASSESHADAQDKTNDALRVNANELRCRAVGEGGNLGCTQLGRIEFALNGGKIYTDAIDNSAGVDCSDHEVNIKILVDGLVSHGHLPVEQRSDLLAEMTDEVSDLVLRDNYLQTQCISLAVTEAPALLGEHALFMNELTNAGKLNPAIEFLPDHETVAERAADGHGLSAPEIAVLVAYSKMDIYEQLRDSELVKDTYFDQELVNYFPRILGKRFSDQISQHQLRNEIIATQITNSLVNRLGPTYLFRLQEELGASTADIASAYVAVRAVFKMRELWDSIEALDNQVSSATQYELLLIVRGWVERGIHWLVKNRRVDYNIQNIIDYFETGTDELRKEIPEALAAPNKSSYRSRCKHFVRNGVPQEVAESVSSVVPLSSSFDIIDIAATSGIALTTTAGVYFQLGDYLEIQWLREQIGTLETSNHWHGLAKSALRSDLHYQQRHLCAEILSVSDTGAKPRAMVKHWAKHNDTRLEIYSQRLGEIKSSGTADYAMLSLAVTEVHKLLQSSRPLAGAD